MVCDTFDSMTSDRPYRRALSAQDSLNEILKYSGTQFDPRVVEAFLDIYDQWVKEKENLSAGTRLQAA
jgi:HD-GYP domain-containing protein (c-di-GMP phosphodiesterase class II)